jgi:hypothetical protein
MSVKGVKSVDFKIKAIGNGVVNWNGNVPVRKPGSKDLNNHTMPKLRGYTNESGKVCAETGFRIKKLPSEINFKETPMYISQNCVRHHLFKDQAFDFHFANSKNQQALLTSLSGLIRGYVIPQNQCKRKSALLIEDFVDQLGNGNFEQFGNSGAKDSNSIYSKTTFGKTEYLAHGSISIEEMQFISLDKKFDRESIQIKNEKEGVELAKEITEYLRSLSIDSDDSIVAEFGTYTRVGSIFNEGEVGILLSNSAVALLVDITLEMLQELSIQQAKGWMSVDTLDVDYNNSKTMMRIIRDPSSVNEELEDIKYAVYYQKIGD